MTGESEKQRLRSVLRRLLVAEVILIAVLVASVFLEDPFLPPLLQQYHASIEVQEFSTTDMLWLAVEVPAVILWVCAYIGLWRGWSTGRLLYLVHWVSILALTAFAGPVVMTGVVAVLSALETLVGGLILGLLYFSELRDFYDRVRPGPG